VSVERQKNVDYTTIKCCLSDTGERCLMGENIKLNGKVEVGSLEEAGKFRGY
jgi:hypothetical protein